MQFKICFGNSQANGEKLQLILRVVQRELFGLFSQGYAGKEKRYAGIPCSFVFPHLVAIIPCLSLPLLPFEKAAALHCSVASLTLERQTRQKSKYQRLKNRRVR